MGSVSEDQVVYLLRRAGEIMVRMPGGGVSLALSRVALDGVDDPRVAYGYSPVTVNRVRPTAYEISFMDFVHPWLSYIGDAEVRVRRVVAHRMLWDAERGRSIWSYRRLAQKLHTSPTSVKDWDQRGVGLIFRSVRNKNEVLSKIGVYLRGFEVANTAYADVAAAERR